VLHQLPVYITENQFIIRKCHERPQCGEVIIHGAAAFIQHLLVNNLFSQHYKSFFLPVSENHRQYFHHKIKFNLNT